MKKNRLIDVGYVFVILGIVTYMVSPYTKDSFNMMTTNHPFVMAYIKFFILASMGELLGIRIVTKEWQKPQGFIYRALLWGMYGMLIALAMKVFSSGVATILKSQFIPLPNNAFVFALLTSTLLNSIFGPTFMTAHKFTDAMIDIKVIEKGKVTLDLLLSKMDWKTHIGFVVLKTIPLFWIPAHTIVFLLPEVYRVIVAAFLSVALGAILAFAKRKKSI